MRIQVARVFFYDSIPSVGTNCVAEAVWDTETGAIYHGKSRVSSFSFVREMTILEPKVEPAAPVTPGPGPRIPVVDPIKRLPDPKVGAQRRRVGV